MCAAFCYSLLLILLAFPTGLVIEGLPLTRQERGSNQDIIAGADFLSVLIDSTTNQERQIKQKPTILQALTTKVARINSKKSHPSRTRDVRIPRSTHSVERFHPTTLSSNDLLLISEHTLGSNRNTTNELNAMDKLNSSLIVSVHVSSSVSNSKSNKLLNNQADNKNHSHSQIVSELSQIEPNAVAYEEHASLTSDSNKSDFSVNEQDPITSRMNIEDEKEEYPADVRTISSPYKNYAKEELEPFGHHSVVYHDEPTELIHDRSVSYSTVIQSVPHSTKTDANELNIKSNETTSKDRQNRSFEFKNGPNENQHSGINKHFNSDFEIRPTDEKVAQEVSSSAAETNDYFVTARYETVQHYPNHFSSEKQFPWRNLSFNSQSNFRKTPVSTEKHWEVIDKPREYQTFSKIDRKRTRIPLTYGKPEQNYEIDESVSVMSNGRVHGVQTNKIHLSPPNFNEKNDVNNDSQKVGYVVEGRNYRKYRVEERTSDGFIVGEYGVVSHDDGSLRGVRYTADGTTNPRLIYDALMKFLSL